MGPNKYRDYGVRICGNKVFRIMKRISLIMLQENNSSSTRHSGLIGVFLVILGVLVTGLALLNFFQTKKQIDSNHYLPSNGHIISLCIGIIVMEIALLWYLAESITTN